MGRRVWTRRSRGLLATGLLAGCIGLTWFLVAGRTRGSEITGALSLTVAIVTTGGGWLLRPYDVSHTGLISAAQSLAGQVEREWTRTRQKLLADTGAPRPAEVGYVRATAGSLGDIARYYTALRRGRLVVLGPPGSGKTVLAIQLLLDRIAALPADPGQDRLLVPVMMSLSSWRPENLDADDQELSAELDAWIVRYLAETYRVAEPVGAALVNGGWVLAVLDGLDEMDVDMAGAGQPPRAVAVVRALNQDSGTGLRRVVVTSREHRYQQLLTTGAAVAGMAPVLQDATVVRVQPLTVDQVITHLEYRFPDPTSGGGPPSTGSGLEHRWRPVRDELTTRPHGPLAEKLGTPWRLFLAITKPC